jgi:tetratricopeptide (TPR) repeat protein
LLVAHKFFDEAIEHARIAARADPDDPIIRMTEPWMMSFAGRHGPAIEAAKRALSGCDHCPPAQTILGDIYSAAQEYPKALEHYQRALAFDLLPHAISCRGFVYGRLNKPDEAARALSELEEAHKCKKLAYLSSWHTAVIRAGLDEPTAISDLEKAYEEGCDWLIHLGVDPHWDELRNKEKFKALLKRLRIGDFRPNTATYPTMS